MSGGDIFIKSGCGSSGIGGDVTIKSGYMTEITEVKYKDPIVIKPWKKILCFFLGHKDIKVDEYEEISFYVPSECGKFHMRLKACERCGIYSQNTFEEKITLSKEEKMVKDLIE